jgi:hypothetical protein
MMMPGRKFSAGSGYRYGFNGKENDNEVKGEGNQQDYGMRIYDPNTYNLARPLMNVLFKRITADASIKATLGARLASGSADFLMQYINRAPEFGWVGKI